MCPRVESVAASRTHRCELGKARELDPPALVVREMEVEDIELVPGDEVERAQHGGLRLEVAGDVEHEPAVAEAGSVDHTERREHKTCAGRGRGPPAAPGREAVGPARGRAARRT